MTAIRITGVRRFDSIALTSLIGFVLLGFLPAFIAGSFVAGGAL